MDKVITAPTCFFVLFFFLGSNVQVDEDFGSLNFSLLKASETIMCSAGC